MSVLVCGEMLYDVFVAGPTEHGFALDARIGGSALNVAVGLARLGRPVRQLTGVSTDMFGQRLAAFLASEGVGTELLKRTPAPTTLAAVTPGTGRLASLRILWRGRRRPPGGAHRPARPRRDRHAGVRLLLADHTADQRPFLELARRAKARSPAPLVVLDPNVRRSVEPDPAVWRQRIGDFAPHADLIKTSREDIEEIYDRHADAIVSEWLQAGIAAVIVTDGPRGASLNTTARRVTVAAGRVPVVDTVGAGDSFLAATLTALSDAEITTAPGIAGLDEAQCRAVLDFAVRAAAITCSRRGADLPRRAELAAI